MRKFKLSLLFMVFSLGLMAQTARLQAIHNSPSPTVDIWVNGVPFLTNFEFRTATPFIDVPAGVVLELGIAPSPSSSPADIIATFPVTLDEGSTYVVMANGVVGNMATPFDLEIYSMGQESGSGGDVQLLTFHGSPDAPAVDISARGIATLVSNLSFSEYQGYLAVAADSYILDISPAGTGNIVASFEADLSGLGGSAAVVFASGYLGGSPGFGLFAALPDGEVIALPALSNARVQIIHNSPSPTVDIWVNDVPFLTNFDFRSATTFVDVIGNTDLNIGIAPSPSSSPADIIATFPVNFLAGETYTVIANGVVGDTVAPFNLETYSGAREMATQADETDILVFHGSPDAPAVDIAVRGIGNVLEDLTFGAFSDGYLEVPSTDIILDIKPAGSEIVLISYLAPLSVLEGQSTTVFASGFLGGDPGFGLYAALADGTVIALPVYVDEPEARLQIIHNSPSPTVDIWVNNQPFLTNVAFRTATPFISVPAETNLIIGVAPAPSNSPSDIIASFDVTLTEDETYIVIANGIVGDINTPFNLEVIEGAQEQAINPDKVEVLVFHGSPDAPAVDVLVNGGLPPAISNLAFTEVVGYIPLDPAIYNLSFTPTGDNGNIVATYAADISTLTGEVATIFASGLLLEAEPAFGLWVALADGTTFPLSVVTSTENLTLGSLAVYPNPVEDQLHIQLTSVLNTQVTMSLIDLHGRAIISQNTQAFTGENILVFPMTNVNPGMYFLEMRPDSGEPLRIKVMKQ